MSHHSYTIRPGSFETIREQDIAAHTAVRLYIDSATGRNIIARELQLNQGLFSGTAEGAPVVSVVQENQQLSLHCNCDAAAGHLCAAMAEVLIAILRRELFGVFFHAGLRRQQLQQVAADYGLEQEPDLDPYFVLSYQQHQLKITPLQPQLTPVTADSIRQLQEVLLQDPVNRPGDGTMSQQTIIVLRQHKFYRYLVVELYAAAKSKDGKLKNPLSPLHPLDLLWQSQQASHIKFFTAVHKFQQVSDGKRTPADLVALRALVHNPAGYDFYRHDPELSEQVTAASLVPVNVAQQPCSISLDIAQQERFYRISARLQHPDILAPLEALQLKFGYFLQAGDTLYLPDGEETLKLAELLRQKGDSFLVHHSRFPLFKAQFLDKLGDRIVMDYQFMLPATPAQLKEFDSSRQRLIYLSDFGSQVLLIPVLSYNDVEIPVRSKRQIHATDSKGRSFLVHRDDEAELAFTVLVLQQHPSFAEQLDNDFYYFYLPKTQFLSADWFLDVFETWREQGITVLGFNELEGNKQNPYKAKIDIKVRSGINWFNALIQVRFGKKRASLQQVHKAIRNRNKYVTLDDGTEGILPEEWIARFTDYFNAGTIADEETLHIPRINFSAIDRYFEQQEADEAVWTEVRDYEVRLKDAEHPEELLVPEELQAELRPYQRQGLNWLHYLDRLGFGGCLADDMGLGKTIQVLAFILSQRSSGRRNTNLVVMPATLIFNWQDEIARFAPSLKVLTLYGAERIRSAASFDQYEVILTSYGILLSDIGFLKHYVFNYIFLDESQQIKNPETQRYKAARLLQSRNKIAITGTPIENNTFDLFSQLSFACPGLLGSRQYFKDVYATPIDVFKVSKRAAELQQKIKPFVLRRTKEQVAPELPAKTEMVLYCTMEPEQRRIYDTYEKQFREYISATTSDELNKSPMHVLKGLTKLRQICNSPKLLGSDDLTGTASAKMEVLMGQIVSRAPQHKILVFSQFVTMLNLVAAELDGEGIGYTKLTGSTRNREAVVNQFRNDTSTRVFLISLKAGGTGLNLPEADYVYLVDPWWNPAVEQQAIDRVHRIGQQKKVIAVRLICSGTVEEKIMKMQEDKRSLSTDLVPADTAVLRSMNKEQLLGLLQ